MHWAQAPLALLISTTLPATATVRVAVYTPGIKAETLCRNGVSGATLYNW